MQKVTITNAAVATAKFLFGMCDCTVDIDVGTGDFSLVLGILHVWTRARAIARVSGLGLVILNLENLENEPLLPKRKGRP